MAKSTFGGAVIFPPIDMGMTGKVQSLLSTVRTRLALQFVVRHFGLIASLSLSNISLSESVEGRGRLVMVSPLLRVPHGRIGLEWRIS